jgi:O-antigen/teichoic acid export membrane protein
MTRSRLAGWIGWAGLEAAGRLALLTAGAAAISRVLSPRDFGVTALALTFAASAAVCVGVPFEEALARRRSLRKVHLEAALGASWAIGLGILAISVPAGWALARLQGEPQLASMLPVATAALFFTGHAVILTALARRLRRFNAIAIASLAGHTLGVPASLAIAFAGGGPWALIAQRLLIAAAAAAVLQWRLGFTIRPRWSLAPLREFGGFARVAFLDRLTDNLNYLVFNNFVAALFGATVLGYVNMAMRLIEPVRGAIDATAHNLAFSFFASAAGDRARLGGMAERAVALVAPLVAPVFLGMAAVAPTLLPLVAGPGWDGAIGIATCLALGAALAGPPRLILTALSAGGRPEFGLASTVAGFAASIVALAATAALGPIGVGLARVAGDATRAAVALGLSSRALEWTRRRRWTAVAPAWALSAAMALAVAAAGAWAPLGSGWARLAALVLLGAAVYLALLAIFARATLFMLFEVSGAGRFVSRSPAVCPPAARTENAAERALAATR